jgi:eukaryotic-like serine/threonine-protein kinase
MSNDPTFTLPPADPHTRTYHPGGEPATLNKPQGPFTEPLPEIPGYELLGGLGRGGMGVVYRARQRATDRTVAVKMLSLDGMDDPTARARFRAEAEATAKLSHPNIVPVYEAGEVGGRLYLVCEYLPGGSLTAQLDGTPWAADRAAKLIAPLARGVAAAHAAGIVHRDMKPSNILLAADGTPKVADFGVAKRLGTEGHTHTGAVLGTPSYMAPEQAGGAKGVGPSADVYGLGAVLYELLTGHPPFKGSTFLETMDQLRTSDPITPRTLQPKVARDLETICLRCLEKEPEKRYPSADALADDLDRFLHGQPIVARPVGAIERAWKWVRRNPSLAAAAAGVMLALLIGTVVSTSFALVAGREASRATLSRTLAQQKAKEAADERDAARTAQQESQRRMIRMNIMTGTRSLDAGEPAAALLWFHQAWELDRPNPQAEPSHRARLAGLLQSFPELLGVCFHRDQVCDAAFSPDSRRLLARTEGNEVFLWDYEQCRLAAPPLAHTGKVRHACWSPDGLTVATASEDGSAIIWDARTGARRHTLAHKGLVNWVAYHPQGTRIVTASEDGSVRLWDVNTGKALDWPFPPGAVVDHVAFSPDGSRLIVARRDDTVRVWSVDPPQPLSPPLPYRASTPTERYRFHYDRWPRFGKDGLSALSFQDENLIVWPGSGAEFKSYNLGYGITEIHPIPGTDHVLATGNKYNRVAVVRMTDGKDAYVLSHPRQANIGAASPDGKYVMTASSGGLIHLRTAATGEMVWPPQKCGDFASAVAVSPDGKRCLAASQDGTVRVWSVAPRHVEINPYRGDGRANHLSLPGANGRTRTYSPDGKLILEYGGGKPVEFGPASPEAKLRPLPHEEPVDLVLLVDDGTRFLTFNRESARVWNIQTGAPAGPSVRVVTEGKGIGVDRLNRLSRDGARLAVWDDERTVSVWDLVAGRRVLGPVKLADPGPRIFGPPESHGHITGLVLSADGKWLTAATDSSGALTVWEVDTGRLAHHTAKRFQGFIQGFAFSTDGESILVWASDNNARVYRTRSGEPIGPAINPPLSKDQYVRVHPNECAISADGRWLAIFDSRQKAVRLYDARWADCLLQVNLPEMMVGTTDGTRSPIARLWFAPDGAQVSYAARGKAYSIILPRFEVPAEMTAPLVRFLTGYRIDATDGLEFLDPLTFRADPDTYRRVILAWKGLADDLAAQPPKFPQRGGAD